MNSRTKLRFACGVGPVLVAAAASVTVAVAAASPPRDMTSPAGITVTAASAEAPDVLVASLEGRNEQGQHAAKGQALLLLGLHHDKLSYSLSWRGTGTPTEAHLHTGGRGVDGPVVIPLFTTARHPARGSASGTVTVRNPAVLAAVRSDPAGFYADLHTRDLPHGAARAQLQRLRHPMTTKATSLRQESVAHGDQIYACTPQADGSFAFVQRGVDAHLTGGVHHTFVHPVTGPPQWQAPDGSAVSGTIVTKIPNGDANIVELDLDATQTGTSTGLLARTVEVLRLNTVGGLAPAGPCDPRATSIVKVPYQADYVFVTG